MALQPFDYTLKGIPDPGASFLTGLKRTGEIQDIYNKGEAARIAEIEAQQKQAQQEAMAAEMAALANNPTVQGINRMMAKYPAIADKYKPLLESMTDQQKQARIKQANDIYAPMASGRKDIALENLNMQIEAARNAGDEQSLRSLDTIKKMIESPETGQAGDNMALIGIGSFLSATMGEKEFAKTYEGLSKVQIEQAEATIKRAKSQAELEKLQQDIEAGKAPDTKVFGDRTKQWNQNTKQWIDVGPAPKGTPLVSVGLNEGQKGFDNETTLRKEFNAEAKPFNEAMGAYSRLQSAAKDNTGASDIAIIYAYMKMLDPGSVVREGEFATAENAGGVGAKVRNMYNKVLEGKRLTPEVRQEFLSVAKNINTESKVKFNSLKRRYKGISKDYGLNPENVITLEEPENDTPTNPSAPRTVSVDY